VSEFSRILRRRYVAIATDKFTHDPPYRELKGVAEEVRIITDWLTDERLGERRFAHAYPGLQHNPDKTDIERCLRDADTPWAWTDALALYITGHGDIDDKGAHPQHYLILSKTESGKLATTALSSAELLRWLGESDIEHLLIIIDVCFAGLVAEELGSIAKDHWLILPSAQKNRGAGQLALAEAISKFIRGADKYNRHVRYLTVGSFVDAINDQLPKDQLVEEIYNGRRTEKGADRNQRLDPHVCLPNPSYEPDDLVRLNPARHALALRKDLLRVHNRVSGRLPTSANPGWLFTSRPRLGRDLIRAASLPGVTMVTGSAGCGKSTALSRLVTLSDPGFRRSHGKELRGVPADLRPSPRLVDVAVSARGQSSRDVVTQICFNLSLIAHVGSWDDPVAVNRKRLSGYLAQAGALVTIVIDSLDEADAPVDLVRNVLLPLAVEHSDRLCLIVGVRSPEGDNADGGAVDVPGESLTDLLAKEAKARRIVVDDNLRWDADDIKAFIRNVLTNTSKSPYRNASDEVLARFIEKISRFAGRSYFTAEVAASSLAGRALAVSPDDPRWLSELEGGLLGAVRGDLQAHFPQPDWRRAVALLRAVAFARGTGLPWHRVWPRMAEAVDDIDGQGSDYGDVDVRWLLGSRLNAYLRTEQQDDLTVYRLIHDELGDILKYRWRELLDSPEPAQEEGEVQAVERRIARSLSDRADVEPTVSARQVIPPYVRRHLSEHALAGGVLEQYLPVPFLPYLDIARLATAVGGLAGRRELEEAIPWLPLLRRVTHLWDWERPARNAAAIEMWAALAEVTLLATPGGPWQVRWAAQPLDLSTVLGRQQENVRAVAVAGLPEGPVAMTGGGGGLLYTWDLSTSGRYRDRAPVATGGAAIVAIATVRLSEQVTIAVTGSEDGMLRFWNVAAGHAIGAPLDGGGGAIRAVATARLPDGRVVVIAADAAGTIRTWNLLTREPVGTPVECGLGMTLGITTIQLGARVLGLATGEDSGLQVWDVETGTKDGPRLAHRLSSSVWTRTLQGGRVIAAQTLGGVEVAIAGDGDGLLLWDLRTREPMRRVTGGDGKIRSLVTVRAGDQVLAVTGASAAVQVLDLQTGNPVGDLLSGHAGSVEATGIATMPDGSLAAVSGSRDSSVRMWDVPGAALAGGRVSRHVGIVEDVAIVQPPDGQAIALTCGDTAVRAWGLERGDELARLAGHDSPVVAVAAAATRDGVLVVAGHWDGKVSAWRATDGALVSHGRLGHLGAATSLAMATLAGGGLVAVAGGWDGTIRFWDPLEGVAVAAPLRGHAHAAVLVATTVTADGRVLVISGGADGQVRIRDLEAHLGLGGPGPGLAVAGIDGPVASLTTGVMPDERPCVIVGGAGGMVSLLDLLSGTPVGEPWKACPGSVTAVAAGRLPTGQAVVFTGGAEALVQAWDPASGRPAGEALPVAGPVRAMAFHAGTSSLVIGGMGVAVARPRHDSARG
jgi:WD40 repeat protein